MSKINSKQKNNTFQKINKTKLFFSTTIFIVFFVYSFSLFRPWLPFDERLIYNEELFPIPITFREIFEVINSFALNCHVLSMNTFFSNHLTLRSGPTNWVLMVFIFYLFKKNAFLYHLFGLFIHLINTSLLWLIFLKTTKIFHKDLLNNSYKYLPITFFTLGWALHSVNTEAILLSTNWNAILLTTFCLSFILYEILKITQNVITYPRRDTKLNFTSLEFISILILFCFAMFLCEYAYTLPLVLFALIFGLTFKLSSNIKKSFLISFKQIFPYFVGLLIFILLSFLKPSSSFTNLFTSSSSFYTFIERNLWLTPQIFIHFLGLLLFPKTLSTYQSNLIHFSDNLFNPYSIFCTSFYLFFLTAPVILFVSFKTHKHAFIYPLIYAFYFSMFPFLHIVLPTYCLIAERYCYFPLFLLLFFVFNLLSIFISSINQNKLKQISIFIICILLVLTSRTLIRINEWNNPYTFYKSATKVDINPLNKAYKLIIYASYARSQNNQKIKDEAIQESLELLNKALKLFKNKVRKNTNEPITLKLYGLDSRSLLLKTVFAIATIKNDYYNESPKSILAFYEPIIRKGIHLAFINQIALYAQILSADGQLEKAKRVLEYGLRKFPYSLEIMLSLANFYFYEKDLVKTYSILNRAYKDFPNDSLVLHRLLSYYEIKNDLENQAKFLYLIGLRNHSKEAYQKAAEIYLHLNQPKLAHKALEKLTYF